MNFPFYTENLQDVINEIAEEWMGTELTIELLSRVLFFRISSNVASSRYVNLCAVYLLVCQLERPHINILSKLHLVTSKKDINMLVYIWKLLLSNLPATPLVFLFIFVCRYLNSKPHLLINQYMAPQFQKLNTCFMELVSMKADKVYFHSRVWRNSNLMNRDFVLVPASTCILPFVFFSFFLFFF
nr:GPN-loop GTPase 3-like [Ipomoea batatas]